MSKRWGVLGTGGIAAKFLADLPDPALAVASRRPGGADAIAARFGVQRAYGSYEELCADPDVDVVYVATPHPFHLPNALLAIGAGKHVLVEKPFTMTAAEARELVAAARGAGVFCMEAMWSRFLPTMVELRRLVTGGSIGRVLALHANLGQRFAPDPAHRLFAPGLGGGALLDIGVYVVSFASMVLGPPSAVRAFSAPAMTGVDLTTSLLLDHPGGAHALLSCSAGTRMPATAWITGETGRIELEPAWYAGGALTLVPFEGEPVRFEAQVVGDGRAGQPGKGMRYQVAEVERCLAAGETESPVMPLDETVSVLQTLDAALAPDPS